MPFTRIPALLKQIRANAHNTLNYAAQASYNILLAFLPLMMIYYLISYVFFANQSEELLRALDLIFPADMLNFTDSSENLYQEYMNLGQLFFSDHPLIYSTSTVVILLFVAYALIRAVRSLMVISTRVSGFEENRSFLTLWKDALYNSIALCVFVFISIYFYVTTSQARHIIEEMLSIAEGSFLHLSGDFLSYLYLFLVLFSLMTWMYTIFPSERLRIYQAFPGAFFTVVLWEISTQIISWLQDEALWPSGISIFSRSFNLIFYVYLFSYIFILGAILNVQKIRLNADRNYSDQIIAARADHDYEIHTDEDQGQIGQIDRSLFYKSRNEDISNQERISKIVQSLSESFYDTNFPGICTQLAFYMLCALVPLIIFLLEFVSRLYPDFEQLLFGLLKDYLPTKSYLYLTEEIKQILNFHGASQMFMGVVALLMSCVAIHSLLSGINQTYGYARYASKKRLWIKSFIATFVLGIGVELLLFIYTVSDSIQNYIYQWITSGIVVKVSSMIIFMSLSVSALLILMLAIYMIAPENQLRIREALPGAVFSVSCILIIFRIYLFFLNRSSTYMAVYGSQSGIFTLLVVMFFFSCVLNIGAKINVIFMPENPFSNMLK